jgi:hypothetical protein
MSDNKKYKDDQPSQDRRDFFRRLFKKGAPLVVGAVAKPLSRLAADSLLAQQPKTTVPPPPPPAEGVSDHLRKEFERQREEFMKDNPDFDENR